MGRSALRFGPFRGMKWAVSHRGLATAPRGGGRCVPRGGPTAAADMSGELIFLAPISCTKRKKTVNSHPKIMIRAITIVALGGALGSAARYMLSRAVGAYVHTAWPLATFAVNIIGCAAIGFISAVASRSPWMGENTRLFLTVGLCGGFTTFSTFMGENFSMARNGQFMLMAAYLIISLALGFVLFFAGYAFSAKIRL